MLPPTTPAQQTLRLRQAAAANYADAVGRRGSRAWVAEYRRLMEGYSPRVTFRPFRGLASALDIARATRTDLSSHSW